MKKVMIIMAILGLTITQTTLAKSLSCKTLTAVSGWDGAETNAKITVKAEIISENKLKNPTLSGAFGADYAGVVKGVKSKDGKWIRFSGIEDAWCWYAVVVPTNFTTAASKFPGFINKICEEGYGKEAFSITCTVND